MAEKASTVGVKVVSDIAAEMRDSIIFLGGQPSFFETRQRWLEHAARAAGISYRSAKAIFYREDRDPRSSTIEKIRRAIAAKTATEEANARIEARNILERIAFLERRLAAIDPEFFGGQIKGLLHSASPQSRTPD